MPKKHGAIEIQIAAKVAKPKGTTIARELIDQAIRYRVENGENPDGIEVRIVRWRHPPGAWRESDDSAHDWQSFRGLLLSGRLSVTLETHRKD